jgi:hypothetical protein
MWGAACALMLNKVENSGKVGISQREPKYVREGTPIFGSLPDGVFERLECGPDPWGMRRREFITALSGAVAAAIPTLL